MGAQDTQEQISIRNFITGVMEQQIDRGSFPNPDSKNIRNEKHAFTIFTYADPNIVGAEGNMTGVPGGPN